MNFTPFAVSTWWMRKVIRACSCPSRPKRRHGTSTIRSSRRNGRVFTLIRRFILQVRRRANAESGAALAPLVDYSFVRSGYRAVFGFKILRQNREVLNRFIGAGRRFDIDDEGRGMA